MLQNLPTIFVYYEGQMKGQMVGPMEFRGMNLTEAEFEFLLGRTGAIKTEIKEEPVEDDPDWERAAEEEILAANEGLFEDYYSPVAVSPPPSLKRPERKKTRRNFSVFSLT